MANRIKQAFNVLTGKSLSFPLSANRGSDGFMQFFGSQLSAVSSLQNTTLQLKSYQQCPPLAAIVNRKARATTNAKIFLLDRDGKEVKGAVPDKIRTLLAKPNPLQTWPQFVTQSKVFEQIFGEVFWFALTPEGFPDDIKALWVIPNWIMTVKTTGKLFNQTDVKEIIESYTVVNAGIMTTIPHESIIHIRDISPSGLSTALGYSRLNALSFPVANITAAYEARNVLIQKRGAIGILSNFAKDIAGSIPLDPKEKKSLQDDFQKYGLSNSQYQIIITSAALSWQSMTFPTKDLMLFEEIEDDVRQISDCYDYPFPLLGFKGESALSNGGSQREAKASLYQDAIIPEFDAWMDSLNNFLKCEKYGFKITAFWDHLEVLQKSEKDKAETVKIKNEGCKIAYEMKVITREEWRIAIDMDPVNFNGGTFYEGKPANTITVQ